MIGRICVREDVRHDVGARYFESRPGRGIVRLAYTDRNLLGIGEVACFPHARGAFHARGVERTYSNVSRSVSQRPMILTIGMSALPLSLATPSFRSIYKPASSLPAFTHFPLLHQQQHLDHQLHSQTQKAHRHTHSTEKRNRHSALVASFIRSQKIRSHAQHV